MEFSTAAHRECHALVRDYLLTLDLKYEQTDTGGFLIGFDDAPACGVLTSAWGEESSCVRVISWIVKDVPRSLELYEFLLREPNDLILGGFVLDEDGDICFRHTLGGDDLDRNELHDAVMAVVGTALRYRDEIVSRFGGTPTSYH